MRVKCINTTPKTTSRITIGKEYIVLSIEISGPYSIVNPQEGDHILFRLIDDDRVVIPYPANLFDIVSGDMFPDWIFFKTEKGSFMIIPKQWAREGFWEDFYNDEPSTMLTFNVVKNEIYNMG